MQAIRNSKGNLTHQILQNIPQCAVIELGFRVNNRDVCELPLTLDTSSITSHSLAVVAVHRNAHFISYIRKNNSTDEWIEVNDNIIT